VCTGLVVSFVGALTAWTGGALAASGADSWDVAVDPAGPTGAWALLEQATNGDPPGKWAEQIAVTRDGGRSWSNRTPPRLSTASASRSITQLVNVGTTDAWVTYGALTSGSEQTLLATTDGGVHWDSMGTVPSPDCSLEMLTATVGWCTTDVGAMGSEPVMIYRTADGGRHWTLASRSAGGPGSWGPASPGALPTGCDKNVGFITSTVGWASFVCAVGLSPIYGSTDGGRIWAARQVGALPAAYSLPPSGGVGQWTSVPIFDGKGGAIG
jgi:photosystem II stability/assembly factor-like uncharacterized protein